MTFDETLAQVIDLLQCEGRVSYRALKRQFAIAGRSVRSARGLLSPDENDQVVNLTGLNPCL